MYADYPLINLVVTVYLMLLLGTVFAAFGWCDPNEYQKKIGLDVLGGVLTVLFWRYSGMVIDTITTNVDPGQDMLSSAMQIFDTMYTELGLENLIQNAGGNDVLALIIAGGGLVFALAIFFMSAVFAVYFPFRMLVLLDLYVDNIVRYLLMGIALIGVIILGAVSGNGSLTLIMVLFGIISIGMLLIGNIRLYNARKHAPKRPVGSAVTYSAGANSQWATRKESGSAFSNGLKKSVGKILAGKQSRK